MEHENVPTVSVILPVRNEQQHISSCLDRLLQQDYPESRVEILVVDGRSSDDTRDTVRMVMEANPERRIRLLDNPHKVVPHALNIAIREATGDIIVRMDGHTTPDSDYVSACVRALCSSNAANVGGVLRHRADTSFGQAVARAQSHPLGVGGAKFRYAQNGDFVETVPFGAFRRDIFVSTGLFDESLVRNQDYELNVRIKKAGGTIYLDPAIKATYRPRETPSALWRQYFEYGWWRVETVRRHPDSARPRQLLPPLFVVGIIVPLLAAPVLPWAPLVSVCLVVAYAGTVAATGVSVKDEVPKWHLFSCAIAIMHFGFAAGFWTNLLTGRRYPFRAEAPSIPRLEEARPKESSQAA